MLTLIIIQLNDDLCEPSFIGKVILKNFFMKTTDQNYHAVACHLNSMKIDPSEQYFCERKYNLPTFYKIPWPFPDLEKSLFSSDFSLTMITLFSRQLLLTNSNNREYIVNTSSLLPVKTLKTQLTHTKLQCTSEACLWWLWNQPHFLWRRPALSQ